LTPGSIFSSAAVALLMSTISAFGAAAVLFDEDGAVVTGGELVLGIVLVAG